MKIKPAVFGSAFAAVAAAAVWLAPAGIAIAESKPKPPYQRLGVWEIKEGFISHILVPAENKVLFYLTNPEGASIWELETEGPSKRKIVSGMILENAVSDPAWLNNVHIEVSPGLRYILVWPTAPGGPEPRCVLVRLDRDVASEVIPLRLPHGFDISDAAFSDDETRLVVARHPASAPEADLLWFDFREPRNIGRLEPVQNPLPGAPGLVSEIEYCRRGKRLWISAGIFGGKAYSPPLLVSFPVGKGEEEPWIQGNILERGLITAADEVWVLLDPEAAGDAAGLRPNNWWRLAPAARLADHPTSIPGYFSWVRPLSNGSALAVHSKTDGNGHPRLVIIKDEGIHPVMNSPRLAAASPLGGTFAAVQENSNKLEVFSYKPDAATPEANDAA
ncbi:MAG: hypothetical protein HRF49_12510 [bacterium]